MTALADGRQLPEVPRWQCLREVVNYRQNRLDLVYVRFLLHGMLENAYVILSNICFRLQFTFGSDYGHTSISM